MISGKQWAVLLVVYIMYLLVGASVFLYTERLNEITNLKELHRQQRRMTLISNLIPDEELKAEVRRSIHALEHQIGRNLLLPNSFQSRIIEHLTQNSNISQEFNETHTDIESLPSNDDRTPINFTEKFDKQWKYIPINNSLVEEEAMWNYWNSFFFSFTVITTIGFGNMSPKTNLGQIFCLAYSILGLPFNGILFAGLADLFSSQFVKKIDTKRYDDKRRIAIDAVLYLIPGIFVFFILPSIIFMIIEGWSYITSFYFSFITLSTIGFGDFVAGYVELPSGWLWLYRFFIQAWIIFGLGYLLMIITFIQNALRSKKIRMLDRKMAKLLKKKKTKSSSNIQKDLKILGSILDTISNLRSRDEPIGSIIDDAHCDEQIRSCEKTLTGDLNLAFEGDEEESEVNRRISSDKASKGDQSETRSFDIFMHLAEAVLKESDNVSEPAASDDDRDRKEKLNESTTTHNTSPVINMEKDEHTGNTLRPEIKQDSSFETRKKSFSRRLSEWTFGALPSRNGINKALHSCSFVPKEKEEKDESSQNASPDEDEIADLSDLFEKIEKVLSQGVHDAKQTDKRPFRGRSQSMFEQQHPSITYSKHRLSAPMKNISNRITVKHGTRSFNN